MTRFNRARDRALSAPELAAFLRRLKALYPKAPRRMHVQLSLFLGGQRPQQLLRLRTIER